MPNLPTSITPFGRGVRSLPYDAEVEWLLGDGNAYVDSGIMCGSDLAIDDEFKMTQTALTNGVNFDSYYDNQHGATVRYYRYYSQTSHAFQFYAGTAMTITEIGGINDSRWYTVVTNPSARTMSFDGVAKNYSYATDFVGYGTFCVFAQRSINANGNQVFPKEIFIRKCKLTKNGTLVRDFIPVRVGSVGYLYDRVSRQLFGNAGTGNFIVGPDKNV